MLRTAIRTSSRPVHQYTQRSLVSSVLLTRPYDDKSLADLKKEAKSRGLSQSGTKMALISRIQAEDKRRSLDEMTLSPVAPLQRARGLSSSAPTAAEPSTEPERPRLTLDVKIPDLSQLPPETPPHIPFYPDFWESSKVNAAEAAEVQAETLPSAPKIITIAGESTHHAGGPSHNVYQPDESSQHKESHEIESSSTSSSSRAGLWQDIANDLGLPTSIFSRNAGHRVEAAVLTSLPDMVIDSGPHGQQKQYSRPLDNEERKGLWALFGILAGSWIVGGISKA